MTRRVYANSPRCEATRHLYTCHRLPSPKNMIHEQTHRYVSIARPERTGHTWSRDGHQSTRRGPFEENNSGFSRLRSTPSVDEIGNYVPRADTQRVKIRRKWSVLVFHPRLTRAGTTCVELMSLRKGFPQEFQLTGRNRSMRPTFRWRRLRRPCRVDFLVSKWAIKSSESFNYWRNRYWR